MKKVFLSILIAALLMAPTPVFAAGGVTASTSSLSMQAGESRSFTVTANNAACRIDISSSNTSVATVSKASEFIDMSSTTISVSGKAAGNTSVTIRTNGELCATYDGEAIEKTITISVSVAAVPTPAPTPEPTPTPTPTPSTNKTTTTPKETPAPQEVVEVPTPEDSEELIIDIDEATEKDEIELENVGPLGETAKTETMFCVTWPVLFIPYILLGALVVVGIVLLILYFLKRHRLQKISTSIKIDNEQE